MHDLRHTYASLSASAGIPAYRLAEYMGHASEIVTRTIYTHLFATDAAADMDLLARPVAPAAQPNLRAPYVSLSASITP